MNFLLKLTNYFLLALASIVVDDVPAVEKDAGDAKGVESALEEVMLAFQEKNFAKIYYYMGSSDFQKTSSPEEVKAIVQNFPEFTYADSLILQKMDFHPGHVVVRGVLQSSLNKTKVMFHLMKENNTWKLAGIQVFNDNS